MSEVLLADAWLVDMLGDIAPGGVWADVAPPGTPEPFVVASLQDASDLRVLGGERVYCDMTYLVKAVGRVGSYADLAGIVDAVDAALDRQAVPLDNGIVLWCERERPVRYAEGDDADTYRHMGALYRILVKEE